LTTRHTQVPLSSDPAIPKFAAPREQAPGLRPWRLPTQDRATTSLRDGLDAAGSPAPAQSLLVVVPADSHLEIEAMVSNRDIGFVHVDQDVEIKVDTFNFTRYGLIHGKVLNISQDAISHDKQQDKFNDQALGVTTTSSEPKGQELLYAAHVSLDRIQMQIEENLVNLSPGMAVTVEIKTGSRAVITYLLSPLLRYKQESLRER
jgi:hemolysin D